MRHLPCGELREDDLLDPRDFARPDRGKRPLDRKTQQLCRQVMEVLSLALGEDAREEMLLELSVVAVTAAPDAGQLLVLVTPLSGDAPLDSEEVLDCLRRSEGRLRAAVAAGITRKRAPRLLFQFLPFVARGSGA